MHPAKIDNFSKLCLHTITTKPWTIEEAAANYMRAGITAISVWRETLEGRDIKSSGRMLRDSGLKIVSLVRGGFFPAREEKDRQTAIDDNLRIIDEGADLGAPLIVLVCGAIPGQSLAESRQQIQDGIAAVLPHAKACGIKLGIEPLHPMYADNRSAINTIKQANDMTEVFDSPYLGVIYDVYHLWWDSDLEKETARCGRNGKLFAFHICDWKTPTVDILLDRGLMGEGCINLREIRRWIETAGFDGFHEVEIFSTKYWAQDQTKFLHQIKNAYLTHS